MIEIQGLTKTFGHGPNAVTVLDDIDFAVAAGEIFAVVGPSGAGKSTLAQCINLLERPTSGSVVVNGERLTDLDEAGLRTARRRIGTVFQSANLLSRRTAAQNVALPLQYLGVTKVQTQERVAELLDRVGLTAQADRYPHQLSGGQRQRVGIARALALRPSVLLSDEATSGLDPATTDSFLELLTEVRDDLQIAVVFITHEMDTIVKVADRVGRLDHGRIVEQGAVVDLLLDPESALGSALRPRAATTVPAPGIRAVRITHTSPAVPGDWITRIAATTGATLTVLGGHVQDVGGVPVGEWTIGVPESDVAAVVGAAGPLGLAARPLDATAKAVAA